MPYTTELHERHLDRLDLTQDDVEAYLTTEYGMDGFTLEKQNDVYIISAPGEVELSDVRHHKRVAAKLADKKASEAAANADTNAGGQ